MRGTVTKKKDRWYIVYYIGKDNNGKWKQKWEGGFDTKKEAEKVLRARIEEIESGFLNAVDNSTLAVYLRHWFQSYCMPRLAANTISGYRINIERHIIPCIGEIRLNRLQPKDIQMLYGKLADAGLSGTSMRYVHNTLHKALVCAVKGQILQKNAADYVDIPLSSQFEVVPLTPDEAKKLIAASKDTEIHIPIMLALMHGLRRGEVLALQWNDIDFDNGTLSIKHSANYIKGEFFISDTKTKNSHRTLRMSPTMISSLQKHKALQDEWRAEFGKGFNPYNLVICRKDGSPMTPNAVQYLFKEVLSANSLPDIRFHDLRHTNATLMLRNAIPAKIVSAMLGHSTVGMTLDIYSHTMTDMQDDAVSALEHMLKE